MNKLSQIQKDMEFKKLLENCNSIWDIQLPNNSREWKILSSSNKLDMQFIEKYKLYLLLENIIMNEKLKLRKKVSDDYWAEIDWTKVAVMSMYRIKNSDKPLNNENRKETLRLIKEHQDRVDWEKVIKKKSLSTYNEDFIMEFYKYINWINFIKFTDEKINKNLIELAMENNLIDWDAVSALKHFPKNFVEENSIFINWKIFLKTHEAWEVPIECRNRVEVLNAIRHNPDLINLRGDKQAIAETNDRLRRFSWIDRVAGVEGHLQDDTGLWVDTIRGEAADDADNLESDLEHDYDTPNDADELNEQFQEIDDFDEQEL